MLQCYGKQQLSTQNFKFICDYVYESSGIVLTEHKQEMVQRRLTRIVRDRKLIALDDYCSLLKANPESERDYFINAITTNLTSFFREKHHFDYLQQHEIPQLIAHKKDKKLRIWSSACSTGEEPYSIAITVCEALSSLLSLWDVKVLATDIDSQVLSTAQLGVYENNQDSLPSCFKSRYFLKGQGQQSNKMRVKDKLKHLITFKQLNLLNQWPMKGKFDVIFCRNVFIYFDKKTQAELIKRYYSALQPGGLLILGHSESIGQAVVDFENVARTVFRKPTV